MDVSHGSITMGAFLWMHICGCISKDVSIGCISWIYLVDVYDGCLSWM